MFTVKESFTQVVIPLIIFLLVAMFCSGPAFGRK
jgi:hypothetical protein